MSRNRWMAVAIASGILTTAIVIPAIASSPTRRTPPIGMGQVEVTTADHAPEPSQISAFVATHSAGPCQITLAESNFAVAGTTVYCGVRNVNGVDGLFVHIFLPEAAPGDAFWIVNLYQEFAKGYEPPVLFGP